MNWIHFLLWVAGLYTLYYLAVITIDVAGGNSTPAATSLMHELTFSEKIQTQKMEHQPAEAAPAATGPAVIASGGVPIKELFSLARKELIVYTKSVSY